MMKAQDQWVLSLGEPEVGKRITGTWEESTELFNQIAALHDSAIENVTFLAGEGRCVLNLSDVYKVSDLEALIPAYDGLLVEMSGSRILQPERVPELLGYDIVSAELLPHSLWISTLAGSLTFQFEEIWFSLPD